MGCLILGIILYYVVSAPFKLFLMVGKELTPPMALCRYLGW